MKNEITTQEIMELAKNKKITKDFPYLNNLDLMFDVYMEYPELILLLNDDTKKKLASKFNFNSFNLKKNKDTKKLQESLYYLLPYLDRFPNDYLYLINSEEYYKKLASINFSVYYMLYEVSHNFKSLEEKLFYELYEDSYIFNADYFIKYASTSSIVLLNSLKNTKLAWYYLYYFSKEAFSDDVIKYILETKKDDLASLDPNNLRRICEFPELVIAMVKSDPLVLYRLDDTMLSDYLAKDILYSRIDLQPFFNSIRFNTVIRSSYVMEILIAREGLSYLSHFEGIPTDDFAYFLLMKGFHFQKGNKIELLASKRILKDLIENGDLDVVFKYDFEIPEELIEKLIERIKHDKYIIKEYNNKSIIKSRIFKNFKEEYIKNGEAFLSTLDGFNQLKEYLNLDDVKIIEREIIKNNYYLDLDGIIKNSSPSFYIELYKKLVIKEDVLNHKFNFYLFIKISEYFTNNLNLLKELYNNSNLIDKDLIINLINAINRNDYLDFNTLKNYNNYLYNSINNSSLDIKDKLYKYLVNANSKEVEDFLTRITDLERLTWIELEFPENSYEYVICESYLEIIKILLKVRNNEIDSLEKIKDYKSYALFDLKVIKNNILRLYGIIYSKMNLSEDKLIKENRVQVINGNKVASITGMDFCLFTHSENFNDTYDFTDIEPIHRENIERNYICTSMVNQFNYSTLSDKVILFTFDNPTSLIAFGNRDIFIEYSKAPLILAHDHFGNPYETSVLGRGEFGGYVSNEFDFLRVDDSNHEYKTSFSLTGKIPEEKSRYNTFYLVFDSKKHEEIMKEKFEFLKENISTLNYHDLYYLIVCCYRYGYDNLILDSIKARINKLSLKEQLVINGAITKFQLKKDITKGAR